MAPTPGAIGIHLGTTYCAVAYIDNNGVPRVIPNALGKNTTPSWVYFNNGDIKIGEEAINAPKSGANLIYDSKRLIGQQYANEAVQKDKKLWSFDVVRDDSRDNEGKAMIKITENGKMRLLAPEKVSAELLKGMIEIAKAHLGDQAIGDVVITVPAHFGQKQRTMTLEAARIAGLKPASTRLLTEPTAAAIAYGMRAGDQNRAILIYDLGGGTFDVSVGRIINSSLEILGVAGDTHLGGQDFDEAVANDFIKDFEETHSVPFPREDLSLLRRLRNECRIAKERTSATNAPQPIEMTVSVNNKRYAHTYSFDRKKLYDLCMSKFEGTMGVVDDALNKAGLKIEEINDILLVGGSTRIKIIETLIHEKFPNANILHRINPDEAIALGAAIMASQIDRNKPLPEFEEPQINQLVKEKQTMPGYAAVWMRLGIHESVPLSIGMELRGGLNYIVIPRGTPFPVTKTITTSTIMDNQPMFIADIFEGERTRTRDNEKIGTIMMDNLSPVPRGSIHVTTFKIDVNGVLIVSHLEQCSGRSKDFVLSYDGPVKRSIKATEYVREAERNREADEKFRKACVLRRRFEKVLNDEKIRIEEDRRLSEAKKEKCLLLIHEKLNWLEGDDYELVDPDEINTVNDAYHYDLAKILNAPYSCVAVVENGRPAVITSNDGKQTLPFVVEDLLRRKFEWVSNNDDDRFNNSGLFYVLVIGSHSMICRLSRDKNAIEILEKFSNFSSANEVQITVDSQIFLVDSFNKSFKYLDKVTSTFVDGSRPSKWRQHACLGYWKNRIYYIGGLDNKLKPVNDVDIFENGKWVRGPALPMPISNGVAIVCNEKLYVIDDMKTCSVLQLSQEGNEWINVGSIAKKSPWPSALAVYANKIYITPECQIFDPEAPAKERNSKISDMLHQRQKHSLITTPDGKLIVIGGYRLLNERGSLVFCEEIEEYDLSSTNKVWKVIGYCDEPKKEHLAEKDLSLITNEGVLIDNLSNPKSQLSKIEEKWKQAIGENVIVKNGTIIGIDFGTTNSSCAVFRDGKVEMIPDDDSGSFLIPSVVSFEKNGTTLVGKDAAETLQNRRDPQNVIYDLKRFMGHQYDNEELQAMKEGWPFQIVEQNNDLYILISNNDREERLISPNEAASYIFEKLKRNAEIYLEKTINCAVIGIPASFNENQRVAIGAAAELAGLRNLEFVVEPNAAALAYGINSQTNSKTVLFHDFGGGTLDISVIRYDREVIPLSTIGDSHLGGNDIDIKLANYFMNQYDDDDNRDESIRFPRDKHDTVQRLISESRRAKEAVSNKDEAVSVNLLHVFNNIDLTNTLNSEIFNALCEEMITRIGNLINKALKEAQLTANKIDQVVLVGGSSRIPSVRKLLEDKFGSEKLLTRSRQLQQLHPEHAIALGAAVRAHELEQQMSNISE